VLHSGTSLHFLFLLCLHCLLSYQSFSPCSCSIFLLFRCTLQFHFIIS
jgi:hypothetical protein